MRTRSWAKPCTFFSEARLLRELPDRRFELAGRDRSLEFRLDPAVAADEKRPGLRWDVPFTHPAVLTLPRIVVPIDLDMDEASRAALEAPADLIDNIDDRTARPARAIPRRREGDDERDVGSQRLRDGIAQETSVGWDAGRELGDPAVHARERRGGRWIGTRTNRG